MLSAQQMKEIYKAARSRGLSPAAARELVVKDCPECRQAFIAAGLIESAEEKSKSQKLKDKYMQPGGHKFKGPKPFESCVSMMLEKGVKPYKGRTARESAEAICSMIKRRKG